MVTGRPKVYLDTNIFQPLMYDSDNLDDRKFARKIFEDLRGDVSDKEIDVVIPKPAIGEVVNNFHEDHLEYGEAEVGTWEDFASEIEWYLDKVDADLCGIGQEAVEIANRLISDDSRLTGTDAIIAACALEDDWSNHLVTGDPDFHHTDAIQEIDQERQPNPRWFELNVTDNY